MGSTHLFLPSSLPPPPTHPPTHTDCGPRTGMETYKALAVHGICMFDIGVSLNAVLGLGSKRLKRHWRLPSLIPLPHTPQCMHSTEALCTGEGGGSSAATKRPGPCSPRASHAHPIWVVMPQGADPPAICPSSPTCVPFIAVECHLLLSRPFLPGWLCRLCACCWRPAPTHGHRWASCCAVLPHNPLICLGHAVHTAGFPSQRGMGHPNGGACGSRAAALPYQVGWAYAAPWHGAAPADAPGRLMNSCGRAYVGVPYRSGGGTLLRSGTLLAPI